MRSLDQLLEKDDPAWPLAQQWIRAATNQIEVLPASDACRSGALVATQVTTRSPLGAIIYETGGILVDGDLQQYYEGYRWNGWEADVSMLAGDKAFSIYPPLCAKGPDISERDRRPVPLAELYSLYIGEFQTNESRRSE